MAGFFEHDSVEDPSAPRGICNRIFRIATRSFNAKYTHGVLVFATTESEQVLLVKQRVRERKRWGLPGGFLHLRESPSSGARREFAEETGIDVTDLEFVLTAEYQEPWYWHYDHLFTTVIPYQELPRRPSAEILGAAWFDLNADPPPLTAATREALRQMRSRHWSRGSVAGA